MLVLSRKINEVITIGGNIRIVLLDIRGDKARIGIVAPTEIAVWRNELLEKGDQTPENGWHVR